MNQATGTTEKKLVTYNGTLYQIKFKVADDASGNYKISLAARAGTNFTSDLDGGGKIVDTSIKSVSGINMTGCTITVETGCTSHQFGNWTDAGNGKHKRTCKNCSTPEAADHTWNSGEVKKKPTCAEVGVKTYTCTACKATKTESIDKTKNHNFGGWVNADSVKHSRTCSVCKMPQAENHKWNGGSVTKNPTCKNEGVKTYTCTVCKATKNEAIAKQKDHTYNDTCDRDCNICGATRTVTHKYQTAWRTNKNEHWRQCSVCLDRKDAAPHTPGPEATQTKAQVCTVCNYVITPALNHKCKFGGSWTTDDAGHWHACNGCEERDRFAKHIFDNACDPDCSVCGYVRKVGHTYSVKWVSDEGSHYRACTVCGNRKDMAAHTPGAAATQNAPQVCPVCNYQLAPALDGAEPSTDVTEGTTEGTGETTEEEESEEAGETTESAANETTQNPTVPKVDYDEPEDSQSTGVGIFASVVFVVAVVALIIVIKKNNRRM
jgi:hypothetical protein